MKNLIGMLVVAMALAVVNPACGLGADWPSLEDYVDECVLIVKCKTEKKAKFQYRILETWKGKFSPTLFLFYDTPPEGCLFAHQNHGNDRPRNGREVIFFFTRRNQPDFAKGKLEHHSACFNIEEGKVLYAETSDFDEKEYTLEEFKKAIVSIVEKPKEKQQVAMQKWVADPVLTLLQSKLERECRDLKDRPTFEIPESSSGNSLLMRYQTREYMVYASNKAGRLGTELVQREGPGDEGIFLRIHIQPKGEVNQAVVPQTLQEPYWSTYLNVYPVAKSQKQIYVALSSRNRTDQDLIKRVLAIAAAATSAEELK